MDEKIKQRKYNEMKELRNEFLVLCFLLFIFTIVFTFFCFSKSESNETNNIVTTYAVDKKDKTESSKNEGNKANNIVTTYTVDKKDKTESSKNDKNNKSYTDDILNSNYKDYDITIRLDGSLYYFSKDDFTKFIINNSDKLSRVSIINSKFNVSVSDEEIERMVRSIYVETRDGTFEDSLAVAATMVNCHKAENLNMFELISGNRFGNPEYGEIEEYNFFNADIDKTHQYYLSAIMALTGADPTGGCNAFYMPSDPIDYSCWHESLEYRYTSPNGHRFFYTG